MDNSLPSNPLTDQPLPPKEESFNEAPKPISHTKSPSFWSKLDRRQKQSLLMISLLVLMALPVSVSAVLNEVRGRSKAATPVTPPTTPPITYNTPIPVSPTPVSSASGSFRLDYPNSVIEINCPVNSSSPCYSDIANYTQIAPIPLYSTTTKINSGNLMEYIGFDGNWTKTTTISNQVFYPGDRLSIPFRILPPSTAGRFYQTLLVDAKQCNFQTSPPNCIYYGGVTFTVIVNAGLSPTPTPPLPSYYITPTKYPTYGPTPTPKPQATPTLAPSITPIVNQNPVITTNSLPTAVMNKQYTAKVSAMDYDINDRVTLTATGLPQGLVFGNCTYPKYNQTDCVISGRTRNIGTFPITLKASDNRGGNNTKILNLTVNKK